MIVKLKDYIFWFEIVSKCSLWARIPCLKMTYLKISYYSNYDGKHMFHSQRLSSTFCGIDQCINDTSRQGNWSGFCSNNDCPFRCLSFPRQGDFPCTRNFVIVIALRHISIIWVFKRENSDRVINFKENCISCLVVFPSLHDFNIKLLE